jgi:MscS family membrane protein
MTKYLLLFFSLIAFSLNASSYLLTLMPHWSEKNFLNIQGLSYAQLFCLGVIIVVGIGIRFLVRFLFQQQLLALFSRLNFHYLKQLLKKATTPLGNLFMAGFWAIFIPNLDLNPSLWEILNIAIRIFAGLSSVMLLYRAIDVVANYIGHKSTEKDIGLGLQLVPLLSRAMKIIIVILGGLFVLQNLNVDVTSLLAGMTLGGLAFSFAAKDTVANIFGSVTIFSDQSFKVGDSIKIGEFEGIVLSVGFRSTRVKTFYNSVLTIPNSKFTDSILDNMSQREYRKINFMLGITCDTSAEQIENFCAAIGEILKVNPNVQQDNFQVYLFDYGDSSLNISVKLNVKAESLALELKYRHEILLEIIRLSQKMNIHFAFPTRTLYIQNQV